MSETTTATERPPSGAVVLDRERQPCLFIGVEGYTTALLATVERWTLMFRRVPVAEFDRDYTAEYVAPERGDDAVPLDVAIEREALVGALKLACELLDADGAKRVRTRYRELAG